MIGEKLVTGLSQFFRQANRSVLKRKEVLFERGLRKEAFETTAQQNMQATVERY